MPIPGYRFSNRNMAAQNTGASAMTLWKGGMAGFISDQTRKPRITASPVAHMSAPASVPAISAGRDTGRATTSDVWRAVAAVPIADYKPPAGCSLLLLRDSLIA